MCEPLRRVVVRVVAVLGVLVAAGDLLAQQKASVPDADARQRVRKLAASLYGDRFKEAKTAADKTALAKEMIRAGLGAGDGTADQYILLEIARDIAAGAGDAQTALAAVAELAQRFEVQGDKLKAEALKKAAQEASLPAQRKAVAEAAFAVIAELAAADQYEAALDLYESARSAAQKARDYALVKKLAAQADELKARQKAVGEYRAALASLEKDPGDPAANLAAGSYLCFVKGDWEKGVSMLALGADEQLKSLAVGDLKAEKSPAAQLARGDAWWEAAQRGHDGDALLVRAGYWYRQAEPDLTGIERVKAQKRLAELAKAGQEIPEAPEGPPAAVAPFDEKKAKQFQARWARHLKVPMTLTNSVGMKFMLIPPGEFTMGSTQKEVEAVLPLTQQTTWQTNCVRSEAPERRVKIEKPFFLGACEVTQGQYQQVMGENPSTSKSGAGWPVETVACSEAEEFCRKLAALPREKSVGVRYRLPTEEEWEYACRAGTTTRFSFGDNGALLARHGWDGENSQKRTQVVGRLQPNAWGLFDMHGNVAEWCGGSRDADSTTLPARGGSCGFTGAVYLRSTARYLFSSAQAKNGHVGFRVVREIPTP